MIVQPFLIAFIFSFLGSIPPGSINLSVIQLSLDNRFNAALRFSLAAAVVEFPYAFIAVKFQAYLMASSVILSNIQLIAGVVMLTLGILNIASAGKDKNKLIEKMRHSGFRKGVIISILNPLAIPFWLGVTAYLTSSNWVTLSTYQAIFSYVTGISIGTFVLLALLAILGKKVNVAFKSERMIHIIPGVIFIILGLYALYQYITL